MLFICSDRGPSSFRDKHRAMSAFRGHIQGRSIVFEVAAIFAILSHKQFDSPHLLRPAVGVHFRGLREATEFGSFFGPRWRYPSCAGLMILVVQKSSEAGASAKRRKRLAWSSPRWRNHHRTATSARPWRQVQHPAIHSWLPDRGSPAPPRK